MRGFFQPKGFSFQDFDLLAEGDTLYVAYLKKISKKISDPNAHFPNRFGLIKSTDGVTWENEGDILLPTPNSWEETLWAGNLTKQDGQFVIYYTGTTKTGRHNACQWGKAYSPDMVHWEKDKNNPLFSFEKDNPFYSDEPNLAFRDPFPFEYEGKRYILFCAKDKRQPQNQRGCVGFAQETPNGLVWKEPLFSPGTYKDGLENPALYELEGRWYLLYGVDVENGETAFHYAVAKTPLGPFDTFEDNQLLSSGNYNCRIVIFKGKQLLYHWTRDFADELIRERLAPPQEVRILPDGRISLVDIT